MINIEKNMNENFFSNVSSLELLNESFEICLDKESGKKMFSLSVRVHRQNSRQGTVGCKDRTDLVSRANKKPWKQKGTGRARAGTPRSPIWRGGAVSHGPRARVRQLKINRKMADQSLAFVFDNYFCNKNIYMCSWEATGKCNDADKIMRPLLSKLCKKITLFCSIDDFASFYSFANLPYVNLVSYDAVYPYEIVKGSVMVFLKKDKVIFESLVKSCLK